MLIERITSHAVPEEVYDWLCRRRHDYHANSDIWSFRRDWPCEKLRVRQDLLAGHFRFHALDRVQLRDGSHIDVWTSRDALLRKAQTFSLAPLLPRLPALHPSPGGMSGPRRPSVFTSRRAQGQASIPWTVSHRLERLVPGGTC